MIYYRRAEIEDIQALVDLRIDFMKEVMGIKDNHKDMEVKTSLLLYLRDKLPKDEFIAWIAMDKDQIVATSGISFYNRPPSFKNVAGRVAYIMNMYTLPAYRGNGIAKALFSKLIDEAIDMGYTYFTLNATKMGKPIYEKFGFVDSGDEMILSIKNKL